MIEQTEYTCAKLHNVLPEFLDSYLIFGRTLDGVLIARLAARTQEEADQINQIIFAIARAGGVRVEEESVKA